MKVLNKSYFIPNTSLDRFEHLMNQIQVTNYITFTNDEIDSASIGHTEALHINLWCKWYTIVKVMIDYGLTLNVLLMIPSINY